MPSMRCPCNCADSDAELLKQGAVYEVDTYVFRCTACKRLYKLADRGDKGKKWLSVGESDTALPAVFFTAREAKEFGFEIACGTAIRQHGYSETLTCDADLLEVVETISHQAAIGVEETVTIRKCKGCGQLWHCESFYDSHRGTFTRCQKVDK